jgi:hypothetical protein
LYTEDIADEIIERLEGGETLTRICKFTEWGEPRERGTFPTYGTVLHWGDETHEHHVPVFTQRFARARVDGHRHMVEDCIDIADTQDIGIEEVVEHSAKNGMSLKRARKDMLHHRNLRIHTRLQVIARMDPQRWAERLQQPKVADSGGDDNVIIVEGGLPDNEPTSTQGDEPPSQE